MWSPRNSACGLKGALALWVFSNRYMWNYCPQGASCLPAKGQHLPAFIAAEPVLPLAIRDRPSPYRILMLYLLYNNFYCYCYKCYSRVRSHSLHSNTLSQADPILCLKHVHLHIYFLAGAAPAASAAMLGLEGA